MATIAPNYFNFKHMGDLDARREVYGRWYDDMNDLEERFEGLVVGGLNIPDSVGDLSFQEILWIAEKQFHDLLCTIKDVLPEIPVWNDEIGESDNIGIRAPVRIRIRDAVSSLLENRFDDVFDEAVGGIESWARAEGVEDSGLVEVLTEAARLSCKMILEKEKDRHDPDFGDRIFL